MDQQGNLSGAYKTVEQQISAFAQLGAAVVQRYFCMNSGTGKAKA